MIHLLFLKVDREAVVDRNLNKQGFIRMICEALFSSSVDGQRVNKGDDSNDVNIQPAAPVLRWQKIDADIAKAAPGVMNSHTLNLVDWSLTGLVSDK